MVNKDITIKIRYKDYLKLKKKFKPEDDEYAWHYFMRIAEAFPVL